MEKLSKVLKKEVKEYEKVKPQNRKIEDVLSSAYYQFNRKPAENLLRNSNIRGKYPYQKIISDGKQLGMIVRERGLISLTLDGAERIKDTGTYWVEIYDDFELKGSVFAPGIKDCDENIRIGDEVAILRNKKLCGAGVAMMNGKDMKQSNFGEAIKQDITSKAFLMALAPTEGTGIDRYFFVQLSPFCPNGNSFSTTVAFKIYFC